MATVKKFWSVFAVLLLASCSVDNAKIASYKLKNETKSLTVGDFKKVTPDYLNNNPQWIADTLRHEMMVYEALIRPELVYQEMMSADYTNDPEFQEKLKSINDQTPLIVLNMWGRNSLTNVPSAKFDTVRASHILIKLNPYTNINGKQELLPDAVYQQIKEAQMIKAQNILANLQKSKNLKKDFQIEAARTSDDPGTKDKGGDLDVFFPGQMVKEFDEAVFSAKKTGLIDKVIETQFGLHIIYVTETPKKRSVKELVKGMEKQKASYMTRYLTEKNMQDLQKAAVEVFYTLDSTNENIIVKDKTYKVAELPKDLVLLKIKGQDYTWGMSDKVIETFVPSFVTNKNFKDFTRNMSILQNFMFFVEQAKAEKLDKTAKFKKEMAEREQQMLKDTASEMWMKILKDEAQTQLTEDLIKQYYESQKSTLNKQVNGPQGPKSVPMTFAEARAQIENELKRNLFMEAQQKKDEELKKKYDVKIDKAGLAKYASDLKAKYEISKKKMQKKQPVKQGPPQPNQPQPKIKPNN